MLATIDRSAARALVKERLYEGRVAAARAGRGSSGTVPYGYRRAGRRDDPRHAPLLEEDLVEGCSVRHIFRQYLRLRSLEQLADWCLENDIWTRLGNAWSRPALACLLRNQTYVGRSHFGGINVPGRHPPIIAPIVFNKVGLLLRKNAKRGRRARRAIPTCPEKTFGSAA